MNGTTRSNFALMDEMEERENLQSRDTLTELENPWIGYGRVYRLLRRVHLTPLLALGIVLFLLNLAFPAVFLFFWGISRILILFGFVEMAFIVSAERDG